MKNRNKKLQALYYDSKAGFQVLGCILKNPSLLSDKKYPLISFDFLGKMHKYLYGTLAQMYAKGVKSFNIVDIEDYMLDVSPTHHRVVFKDNDAYEWYALAESEVSLINYDYYYDRLRKFSVLRAYMKNGQDVSELLDMESAPVGGDDATDFFKNQMANFDKMTVKEVIAFFSSKTSSIRDVYSVDIYSAYRKAGEDSYELLESFKRAPAYGLLTGNKYSDEITMGMLRGNFEINSGGSGVGKSRTALRKMCRAVAIEIWDYKKNTFVKNPNNPDGTLSAAYVGTELRLDKEVELIMWAVISGVPTSKIKKYDLTEHEEKRVKYAIDIIKRSGNMHLYDEPNYGVTRLRQICEDRSNNDENLFGLFLDYLTITPAVADEFIQTRRGMASREDQAYLWLSAECKNIAKDFNIYFGSSTQLNSKSESPYEQKNAAMLRGSYAIMDKADVVSITAVPSQIELEKIEGILESLSSGFNKLVVPNMAEYFFKNRGGEHNEVIVFKLVDKGNMETEELFVTDYNYHRKMVSPVFHKEQVSEDSDAEEYDDDEEYEDENEYDDDYNDEEYEDDEEIDEE